MIFLKNESSNWHQSQRNGLEEFLICSKCLSLLQPWSSRCAVIQAVQKLLSIHATEAGIEKVEKQRRKGRMYTIYLPVLTPQHSNNCS